MDDSQRKAMFAKHSKLVDSKPSFMGIKQKEPTFKTGDYVHWKGWGLAKIVKPEQYHDAFAGDTYRYIVNTRTYKGQKFSFGKKTAYPHEIKHVSDADAKAHIKRLKGGN